MLDRLRREDDGFTLVETLAAMIVFAILAVSVMGVILNGFQLTKSNSSRVMAANLAAERIEAAHATTPSSIPDGLTVDVTPPLDGVAYTVKQTANYVAADSGTSLCSGTSSASGVHLAYKLITISVEWPAMGSVKPVRQDTLLDLGVDGVDPTTGTAAIAVTGPGGNPISGVIVTLTPTPPGSPTRVTGIDGCAIFTGLPAGASYSAVLGQDGYVTRAGEKSVSTTPFTIEAKDVKRVAVEYSPAGALSMTLAGPEGLQPPPALGVTLSNAGLTPTQRPFVDCATVTTSPYGCVAGTPRSVTRLWPGEYGALPGTCLDGLTGAWINATVAAGSTAQAVLPLAGVRVEVRSLPTTEEPAGVPLTGYTAYARHTSDAVCLAQAWPMTPAGAAQQSLALPSGEWQFTLTADGSGAPAGYPWPTRTLAVGAAVETIVIYEDAP